MKTVLITGASSGIGLATAKKFVEEGWSVIGTSPSGTIPLESVTVIKMDYLRPGETDQAVEKIKKLGEKIDVLINNAGINPDGNKKEIDLAKLHTTLDVNLIGPIRFTEKIIPLLSSYSHIINISTFNASLSDFAEWSWLMPDYRISKAALNMYTKVLSQRLKDVKVSALDPGWVKTKLGGPDAPRSPEEVAKEIYDLAISNVETGNFWFKGMKRSW